MRPIFLGPYSILDPAGPKPQTLNHAPEAMRAGRRSPARLRHVLGLKRKSPFSARCWFLSVPRICVNRFLCFSVSITFCKACRRPLSGFRFIDTGLLLMSFNGSMTQVLAGLTWVLPPACNRLSLCKGSEWLYSKYLGAESPTTD